MAGTDYFGNIERYQKDLEALAEGLGCDVIEAHCRPGLEKGLKKIGWKREQVVLRFRKGII